MTCKLQWALLAAMLLITGPANAWRPSDFVYSQWPYVYDNTSGDWYWFNTPDQQWCYRHTVAGGWALMPQSGLATGWSWFMWPYAHDFEEAAWFYLNEGDTQWVVNMRTSQWSLFGRTASTPPAEMILIPAGTFAMGNLTSSFEGDADEMPTHTVNVGAFYIDEFEVSLAKWDEVANWASTNGYDFVYNEGQAKSSSHPVHTVTWYKCIKWCNARSEKEGRTPAYYMSSALTTVYRTGTVDIANDCVKGNTGYRLPTEAEWEKAARGGLYGYRFPWIQSALISHLQANYYSLWISGTAYFAYDVGPEGYNPVLNDGNPPYTCPVSTGFAPNEYGVHEMSGNVQEWCWDWHSDTQYSAYPADGWPANPQGPATGLYRVLRGGSWANWACDIRVASRRNDWPATANNTIGFRTVLPP